MLDEIIDYLKDDFIVVKNEPLVELYESDKDVQPLVSFSLVKNNSELLAYNGKRMIFGGSAIETIGEIFTNWMTASLTYNLTDVNFNTADCNFEMDHPLLGDSAKELAERIENFAKLVKETQDLLDED